MRILMVVPSFARAGAETQAVALANGFAGLGHEVHFLTYAEDDGQRDALSSKVHYHRTIRTHSFDFRPTDKMAQIIDSNGIDIVHATMEFSVLLAWMGRRKARRKPPIASVIHTTQPRSFNEELRMRFLYRPILRRCEKTFFVCDNQLEYWCTRFPELRSSSVAIHNGVDVNAYNRQEWREAGQLLRGELGIGEDDIVFSCVAAFRPEKAHDLLLRSFSALSGTAYLLLAGDGPLRPQMEQRVREMGMENRIRFLGRVDEPRRVYAASDVTVLSSVAVETFSMAMLESMAMGVPVIAPEIGGLGEAIEPGVSGWLFPVGDEAKLTALMKQVEENPADGRKAGENAEKTVRARFSEERMVAQTEQELWSMIDMVSQ